MKKSALILGLALGAAFRSAAQAGDIEMAAAESLVNSMRQAGARVGENAQSGPDWSPKQREAAAMAESYLKTYAETFGLDPRDLPGIDDIRISESSHPSFGDIAKVRTRPQRHEGLIVENTEIYLSIDLKTRKIYASGRKHRVIGVPARPRIGAEQARAALIGMEITSYDFAHQPHKHTITPEGIGPAELVILPLPRESPSFFSLAWKIRASSGMRSWDVYLDAEDGHKIHATPLQMH